ncbi:hypothetical protein CVT24_004655 [Panaeolus cyanescens]|uniref:DUF6534 domain-containing protein n=1 Tax=Panaeolus cyanescens TaxID=181874 RepID=A0A409YSJ9_9AGAR|nr:hypothetical protein CVT24_004655 [Panaeolus cyanescens]
MASIHAEPPSSFASTYGALLIGVAFAIFFQGTLTVQAFTYYDSFPNDKLRLKALVAMVYILDLAHLIVIFRGVYSVLVSNWGSVSYLQGFPTFTILHGMLTVVVRILIQAFFMNRIWIMSRKNVKVLIALLLIIVLPVGFEIFAVLNCLARGVVGDRLYHNPQAGALFISTSITDMALALTMCYYLRREISVFSTTNNIIRKCVHMIFGTGLATALIALSSAIAFYVRMDALYFLAIYFQLARTYSNALLASLNARQRMREMMSDTLPPGSLHFAQTAKTTDSEKEVGNIFQARQGIVDLERNSILNQEVGLSDSVSSRVDTQCTGNCSEKI